MFITNIIHNTLNFFIKHRREDTSKKEFRRTRLILICSILTAFFDLFYILVSYLIDFNAGIISQGITFVFFIILIVIIKTTNWKNNFLAYYFILNVFQTLVTLPYFSGGVARHSLILPWISIIPVVALLLTNTKNAWLWYIFSFLAILGYAFIPTELTPITYNVEYEIPFSVAVYTGLILIIFMLNLAFKSNEKIALYDLKIANKKISINNEELNRKNNNILSSINYAYRIQQSILPDKSKLEKLLPDSFIFFLPKDVVSGDFYWIEEANDCVYFTAVDCTGHGVPGAFMSLIGNNLLNQIVNSGIHDTNDILTELNQTVYRTLDQDNTVTKDGMDLAICKWDPKNNILSYSGAKNPMIIVNETEGLQRIMPDKCSIGGAIIASQKSHKFSRKEFKITEPTMIYLFSDGYQDQFGGPNTKKFSQKQMRSYFGENHKSNVIQQKELFENLFFEWKSDNDQIDDVLLMGIRLTPNN